MKKLTPVQKRVLEFVKDYTARHGYPPTIREIGTHFGFFWSAARGHLKALERKGLIRLNPSKSRGIEMLDPSTPSRRMIPLVGRIRAGAPEVAMEEMDAAIYVDNSLFAGEELFCLKVRGDSMKEAGILDGDLVVVRPQNGLEDGEIGVVIMGEEATIKRVFFRDGKVVLKPENIQMESAAYDASDVFIAGKVTGVIRTRV